MKNGIEHDFTSGKITVSLILFAAPLFLSSLLQVVYNMVDMLVVGRFVGPAGLSAVSVGGDVTNFMTIVAIAFSNSGSVIIAQLTGAGEKKKIGDFVGTLCSFLITCAVVVSLTGLFFTGPLMHAMNTPQEALAQASSYSRICMTGLVFIYLYNVISAVLRGMGDSKHPFIFVAVSAILNIVLDIAFVAGAGMGAAGAALATVLSQTVSAVASVVFVIKRRNDFSFEIEKNSFRIRRDMLKTLLALGIPMALKQASVLTSKLFVNSFVNSYGVTVSAVSGIGNKLSTVGNLFSNATNTSGSTMVGQNIGAEKYDRVPKIILSVFSVTAVTSSLLILIILFKPEDVFGVFTSDREVIRVGMEFVPIAVINYMSCIARSGSNALVNGSANYKVNFAVAILDGIVMRTGLGVLFGLVLKTGYHGFWSGDALAGFTPFVIGAVYYATGKWKTRKYVIKN